ncbi:MAG: ribonuclease III [Chloroflexi bacterium]|nr:ribonuclease III [Chloroflexota bacterium]
MPSESGPSRRRSTTSTSTAPPRPAALDPVDRAAELAAALALPVTRPALFAEALVHSSYRNDNPTSELASNQRLEFLGDAVISLAFSDALYARHPDDDEGVLTARRAALVSMTGLARLADRIRLAEYLVLGEGAERANERRRPSVLESTFEALVGAVYVDLGYAAARDWLIGLAAPELDEEPSVLSLKSPKSRLLEAAQARIGEPPTYRVLSVVGPDHDRRYVVEALVGGEVLGTGTGANRREAETQAAAVALERF